MCIGTSDSKVSLIYFLSPQVLKVATYIQCIGYTSKRSCRVIKQLQIILLIIIKLHSNESDHEGYFSDHMNVILSTIELVYQTVLVSQWFALLLSIFSFVYLFLLSIIFNICNRSLFSTYLWIQIPVKKKCKKLSVYVINLNSVSL